MQCEFMWIWLNLETAFVIAMNRDDPAGKEAQVKRRLSISCAGRKDAERP